MNNSKVLCRVCNSQDLTKINSYKHHCYACNDCNNIFHIKKEGRYLLEWLLPRSIFKKLLPSKAFLRLFRDKGDVSAAGFYDIYETEVRNISPTRQSEVQQLLDQFGLAELSLKGKTVLDISGGPGYVAQALKATCSRFVVTEFSEVATRAMTQALGIETAKFDYTIDKLPNVFQDKFDIVLLRSSIIFCPNLDRFVGELRSILADGGCVLVETILPTMGDVLWWQTMEYKFPIIYSQETIEKYFYKHGFSLKIGYRDYGNYNDVRGRQTHGFAQKLFTWAIDYPLVRLYYFLARKNRIAVDQRLHHKMLTQIWQKTGLAENVQEQPYRNFEANVVNQSTHFGFLYNGYLKK